MNPAWVDLSGGWYVVDPSMMDRDAKNNRKNNRRSFDYGRCRPSLQDDRR